MTDQVKGPIAVSDSFLITGRGHVFTCPPSAIPDAATIRVGDVVRFTATSGPVLDDPYFGIDSTYKIRGIEVVRTLMYPPSVKGYGFLVTRVEEDTK